MLNAVHTYLADFDLMNTFESDDDYKNAFFEIICEYAYYFLNGHRYELSDNFKETKLSIVDTNDIVKEFVESSLKTTDDEKDKISGSTMFKYFKNEYPNSNITHQQLLGALKDKNIKYNSSVRCPIDKQKRGCLICVKYINETLLVDEETVNLDKGINETNDYNEPDYKQLYLDLLQSKQTKPEPIRENKTIILKGLDPNIDELLIDVDEHLKQFKPVIFSEDIYTNTINDDDIDFIEDVFNN